MKAFGYIFSVTFILLACISSSLAQRIMVESAYYGAPDRGRDVTAHVQRFADYGEPFRVRDSVNEGDVFYFRGGGYADAGPGYYRRGVQILDAAYGTRGRYTNVTRIVQNFVRIQQPFEVSNQTFGIDPYPGVRKRLKVFYSRNGARRSRIYVEGDVVRL
jgi:hypothetical protein